MSDPLPGGVDRPVAADDLVGGVDVAGHQRLGGLAHGDLDLPADLGQVGEDAVELVMEGLTHTGTVGSRSEQMCVVGERRVNTGRRASNGPAGPVAMRTM